MKQHFTDNVATPYASTIQRGNIHST